MTNLMITRFEIKNTRIYKPAVKKRVTKLRGLSSGEVT